MDERRTLAFPALIIAAVALTAAAALVVSRFPATTPSVERPATAAPAAPEVGYGPGPADAPVLRVATGQLEGGPTGAALVSATGADVTAAITWLTSAGVPSSVAASTGDALTHPFVAWTGPIAQTQRAQLARYVEAGGVLVIDGTSPVAESLAGVDAPVAARRDRLTLLEGGGVPAATIAFEAGDTVGWTKDSGALARFADGSAAIAVRRIGTGVVVLLGVRLEQLVGVPTAGVTPTDLLPDAFRSRDLAALVARTLYGLTPTGVSLGSAPDGLAAALVLLHPLASADAYAAAADVAAVERDRGVRATFAAVTRTAASGDALLDTDAVATLRALRADGFDVAAGGIAPEALATATAGSGSEAHPGYAPSAARGGTTLTGEARVGRHVVGVAAQAATTLFSPPTLLAAAEQLDRLDGALAAAGYTAGVTVAASAVGGSLPYRPAVAGAVGGEVPVLRVPVGFDDAAGGRADLRAAELDGLLLHARTSGAPAVVRLDPAAGTTTTFALQRLLAAAGTDLWVGDASSYAAFYAARYGLRLEVEPGEQSWIVRLTAAGAVPPQTLQLPFAAASARVRGGDAVVVQGDGRRVALPAFEQTLEVDITALGS